MFCCKVPRVQETDSGTASTLSLPQGALSRSGSSCNGSMHFSDRPCSFNGQEGSDSKQRRRLEMEVLSQRTRAVAAERALADVVQDNKKLQEYVMALEGAVASLKLSPSAAPTAFDDFSTDEMRQELHRLAALLQQRDTEGHEQKQKMQSLQQQQLVVQQSTDTIKTWATAHDFPLDEQTLSSKASMYDIPRFGDFEEAMLQQANSWKQSQQQQQQHRVHGGFSSTAGGSALQGALAPEAAACHTEGGCSVLSAASGHSTNSTHVRELKLWFESAQQQAVAPERSKGGRSVGSACQEQT